jgi:hypothetical protein
MKIWAKTKEFFEGKFLVVVPHWPQIDRKLDVLIERVDTLTGRVLALENMVGFLVSQSAIGRMDKIEQRLERIERRPTTMPRP